MNSKRLGILVVLLALLTVLFVSCNSDVADNSAVAANSGEKLVYATFDNSSKGISTNTVEGYKTYNDLYWFYTATKKDSYGTTGQTSNLHPVTEENEVPAKGLSGRVGPFSQGAWSFTLYAYEDLDKTNLYYQGSTSSDVTLRNGVDNYIPVTVTPQGDEGCIKFLDNGTYFVWNNGGGNGDLRLDITLTDSNAQEIACVSKPLTKESTADNYVIDGYITKASGSTKFKAGVYTATFSVVDNDTGNIEFVSQNLAIRVYGNLTTVLAGDLTEIAEAYGYFDVPEEQINVFVPSPLVPQVFDVVPEKSTDPTEAEAQKTKITFAEGALDTSTQHTLKVAVTPIATAATTSSFVVNSGETAVAGINLELKKITTTGTTTTETTVESFNDKYVTIETYISKGFETVTVMYVGDGALPIADDSKNQDDEDCNVAKVFATDSDWTSSGQTLGYSTESGRLVFKTKHFSDYYVKANVEALNVTTNTVYAKFTEALSKAGNGDVIRLLKDVTHNNWIVLNSNKTLEIDLNQKTLETGFDIYSGNITFDNGTMQGIGSNKTVFLAYGTNTEDTPEDSIVVTVGKDAILNGNYAIILERAVTTNKNTIASGLTLNIEGKLTGNVWVMGNIEKGNSKVNIYPTAVIDVTNNGSVETGFANQGFVKTTIYEGATLKGKAAALEVRAGEVNILGGTFSASMTPASVNPNGSGTTTKGSAVAVAQHTTKLNTTVNISGGTFEGYHALYISNPQDNEEENVTVSVSGGTFSKRSNTESQAAVVCSDTRVSKFITGGTYNTDPETNTNYVADGYKASKISDNAWIVVADDEEVSLTLVKAVDSTCTKVGNHTYWIDSQNNKYILDAVNGSTLRSVTDESELVIPVHHSYQFTGYTDNGDGTCVAHFECMDCSATHNETRKLVTLDSDTNLYSYIDNGYYYNGTGGSSFEEGTVIQLVSGRTYTYDASASCAIGRGFIIVGESGGSSKITVRTTDRGLKLQNRFANLPEKKWYFYNLKIDCATTTSHLVNFCGQKAEIGLNKVTFEVGSGTLTKSAIGCWLNQPPASGLPVKADNASAYLYLSDVTFDVGEKKKVQLQSFETSLMTANKDCYESAHIVATGFDPQADIDIQSGNQHHEGIHNEWFLNGVIMESIPGTDGLYGVPSNN